jgi:hypothetical protein
LGYDLHITRKEFWSDENGPVITLEEWAAYVASDPTVRPDPDNPGIENYVVTSEAGNWPLWWNPSGEIFTKNPDDHAIAKMVRIARALDARVLGDDEEIYGVDAADPTVSERR